MIRCFFSGDVHWYGNTGTVDDNDDNSNAADTDDTDDNDCDGSNVLSASLCRFTCVYFIVPCVSHKKCILLQNDLVCYRKPPP